MARTTETQHVTLQDGREIEIRLKDNGQVRFATTTEEGKRVFLTVLQGEGARIAYPEHRTAISWHQPNSGGGTTSIVVPVSAIADWPEVTADA